MGVTIKDVAKKTGLSITTVSLVLNKKQSRIPEKTRQIVESAAQELNYSPNHAAISLATKRSGTGTIALVLPEESHYRPADLLIPAEHACRNSGYAVLLKLVEGDDESTLDSIGSLVRSGVGGVIFDPSKLHPHSVGDYMKLLEQGETPIVSLGGVGAHILPNSIVADHRRGGYLAAMHLLELGHRRIGCIAGPEDSGVSRELQNGYRDALEEKGADGEYLHEFVGAHSSQKSEEGMKRLLARGVTAVLSGSLHLTNGIYRYAYRNGLSIPDDLSVVGYGDSDQAADLIVPLTAVSLHLDRFARKAVALVKRLGERDTPAAPEILSSSLVVRGSTGPAPR